MKSGAESGWDYSSRWFSGSNTTNELYSVATGDIIPVDLNSFLCKNAKIIADLFRKLERPDMVEKYEDIRESLKAAIRYEARSSSRLEDSYLIIWGLCCMTRRTVCGTTTIMWQARPTRSFIHQTWPLCTPCAIMMTLTLMSRWPNGADLQLSTTAEEFPPAWRTAASSGTSLMFGLPWWRWWWQR